MSRIYQEICRCIEEVRTPMVEDIEERTVVNEKTGYHMRATIS